MDPLSSAKRTPLYIGRGKVDGVDSIGKVQPIINGDKSFQNLGEKWSKHQDYSIKLPNTLNNKTIGDEGITVDFWIIKVHTPNWPSNSWGSSDSWEYQIVGDHRIGSLKSILSFEMIIKFHHAHKIDWSILKTSWKNPANILRTSREHLETARGHL